LYEGRGIYNEEQKYTMTYMYTETLQIDMLLFSHEQKRHQT